MTKLEKRDVKRDDVKSSCLGYDTATSTDMECVKATN